MGKPTLIERLLLFLAMCIPLFLWAADTFYLNAPNSINGSYTTNSFVKVVTTGVGIATAIFDDSIKTAIATFSNPSGISFYWQFDQTKGTKGLTGTFSTGNTDSKTINLVRNRTTNNATPPYSPLSNDKVNIFGKNAFVFSNSANSPEVSTVWNSDDVSPQGIVTDNSGNIYFSDSANHRIIKISTDTIVTNFAGTDTSGNDNGPGSSARFNTPKGLAIDRLTGNIYVADSGNNKIRIITPNAQVSDFAGSGGAGSDDGIVTLAKFNTPVALAFDLSGNLYVADSGNLKIRQISPGSTVTTLPAVLGGAPNSLAIKTSGEIFVTTDHKVVKIDVDQTTVTDFAGNVSGSSDGIGTSARFKNPTGSLIDGLENIYVIDYDDNKIRKVKISDTSVSTVAGNGVSTRTDNSDPLSASFANPRDLALDGFGNLYVTEAHAIRKFVLGNN
ncbi:MAG: hypothetical protein HQM08_17525 [Candidatus Riflebacteria bacterium]|nr:hypothetical protein [Candidatus Riflebacteria bacterium]